MASQIFLIEEAESGDEVDDLQSLEVSLLGCGKTPRVEIYLVPQGFGCCGTILIDKLLQLCMALWGDASRLEEAMVP